MNPSEASDAVFLEVLYRGGELLQQGQVPEARDHLERAYQMRPGDEKAKNLLGLAYFKLGDFVRAGGTGAVSGVSSIFPRPFLDLADALRRGDDDAAAAAQERVEQAVAAANGADIALLQAGLSLQGLPAGPT